MKIATLASVLLVGFLVGVVALDLPQVDLNPKGPPLGNMLARHHQRDGLLPSAIIRKSPDK